MTVNTEVNEMNDANVVKTLRGFDFNIDEYIKNPEQVVNKALNIHPNVKMDLNAVRDYLLFRYNKKLNESVKWGPFPEQLLFGDVLLLSFDNKDYKAFVRCREKNMEVILDDGERAISKTVSLPDWLNVVFADPIDGSCSEYGIIRAKEIVLELVIKNRYFRVT